MPPSFALPPVVYWRGTNPGSEIASGAKLPPISDCGDQCCGHDRSNPRHPHKAAARFVLAADCSKVCIDLANPTIYVIELIDQVEEELAGKLRKCSTVYRLADQSGEPRRALRQHDPILGEQTSRVVYQRGSIVHQAIADTMQRLQVLAFKTLHWDKPHSWPISSLKDRLRVGSIVFGPHGSDE
jgi:hypothetical protein